MTEHTALVHIACDDTAVAMTEALRDNGWRIVIGTEELPTGRDLGCLVYDPGFVCYAAHPDHKPADQDPARQLDRLVNDLLPAFAGSGSVVALSTRESLGSASDPIRAAAAAGIVAAVRGLALAHAAGGVTVNTVCALEKSANGLLPVSLHDIAAATAFFADQRSHYITGQTLYVCGGASLLSSLSA
jgi:NAD(P)-dependent dehydrogenase (short-subunit alcohol dehydrogenase family)